MLSAVKLASRKTRVTGYRTRHLSVARVAHWLRRRVCLELISSRLSSFNVSVPCTNVLSCRPKEGKDKL